MGQQAGIGQCGIAHPDEDPAPALVDGITPHPCLVGDALLPRNAHAAPVALIGHAVIAAFEPVAHQAPQGERQLAMAAGVGQGDGAAVLAPVEDDPVAQHGAGGEGAADLVVPGGDVPVIAQEHMAASPLHAATGYSI